MGKIVTALNARAGRLNVMAQNPYNAVIHLGHSNGEFRDFLLFFFESGSGACVRPVLLQLSAPQELCMCAGLAGLFLWAPPDPLLMH